MNQNKQIIKISNWVSAKIEKYELILVLIFILGIILKSTTELSVNFLITLPLSILVILYFFHAYADTNLEDSGAFIRFIHYLSSFANSVAILGILFKLQNWPGYDTLLIQGCSALTIILIIILVLKIKFSDLKCFPRRYLVRILIIALVGSGLYFIPEYSFIKHGFHTQKVIEKTK